MVRTKHSAIGDCLPTIPLKAAADKLAILALLTADARPTYTRKSDPPLPESETAGDRRINRQGEIRDRTGMVFQIEAFDQES